RAGQTSQTAPQPPPADSLTAEQEAKLRELLHQTIARDEATEAALHAKPKAEPAKETRTLQKQTTSESKPKPATPEKPTGKATQPKIEATVPAKETTTVPVQRTRQQRLDELLKAYKADLITPTEYHQQRAKILSEPDN